MGEAIKRSLNEEELQRSIQKMQARANHFGYRCIDVKRDGRCFYHAFILQLSRIHPALYQDLTVQMCLEQITEHIIENQNFYEQFIHQAHGMSLDTFLDKVLKNDDSLWAADILISAEARTFNVDLVIVPNNGNRPSVSRRSHLEGVVYLGHEVEQHYQALEQDPTVEPQEVLNDYRINSQVDELEREEKSFGLG